MKQTALRSIRATGGRRQGNEVARQESAQADTPHDANIGAP
jgi:hypothetical protein